MHLKQESLYAQKVQPLVQRSMLLEQFSLVRISRTSPRYSCTNLIIFQQELTTNFTRYISVL